MATTHDPGEGSASDTPSQEPGDDGRDTADDDNFGDGLSRPSYGRSHSFDSSQLTSLSAGLQHNQSNDRL